MFGFIARPFVLPELPRYLPATPAQIMAASRLMETVVEVPVYHVEECPVCDCSVDEERGYSRGYSEGVKVGEELYQMYPVVEEDCTGLCKRMYRVPRK